MSPVNTLAAALAATSLDHAGAIVPDLVAGAARWERLGFRLSPLSRQRGRLPGRDEESPWATANRCAIFQQGYLELIGVVDDHAFNPWARFLERFEGLHLLALRVPSADAAWPALSSHPALATLLDAPVQRARKLDVDGREQTMGFRNIFSRDAHCPEGRYILIEHQTPAYLWQTRYLSHPNGALALDGVVLCAERDPSLEARLGGLTASAPKQGTGGSIDFLPPGGGRITLCTPDVFKARWGSLPAALPAFAAVEVRFADRVRAARLMEDNGVPVERVGEDWFVKPADTGGFVLSLTQQAVRS